LLNFSLYEVIVIFYHLLRENGVNSGLLEFFFGIFLKILSFNILLLDLKLCYFFTFFMWSYPRAWVSELTLVFYNSFTYSTSIFFFRSDFLKYFFILILYYRSQINQVNFWLDILQQFFFNIRLLDLYVVTAYRVTYQVPIYTGIIASKTTMSIKVIYTRCVSRATVAT
jgi:hypothetical protein